jgi:cytochrome c oxidase assembly factor CtaG
MRGLICWASISASLIVASLAGAHDTGTSHLEAPGWTLDPAILAPLMMSILLFAAGWRRLRARSSRGVNQLDRRARTFGLGWLVLAAALVTPLHEAGERSFAAHMFEHELIMLLAAPLLVLSEPLAVMLWAFSADARRRLGAIGTAAPIATSSRLLLAPVTATLLQGAALWLWHAPPLFDLALASEGWHTVQHISFLLSALVFWSAMLARRAEPAISALCLVVTSIISGALGALMAFANSPWYAGYARLGMAPFGLSPAEDQQIAGLLMWVPGGLVHAGAALLIMRRLLRTANA